MPRTVRLPSPSLLLGRPRALPPYRAKKKKKGFPAWLIPTIAGVGVGAIVVIAAIDLLELEAEPKAASRKSVHAGRAARNRARRTPEPKVPVLTLDWPESQRTGASLSVNGEKKEVPLTGPIEIPLPPSKEQYHFRLERPGFKPKNLPASSRKTTSRPFPTGNRWRPRASTGSRTSMRRRRRRPSGHKNVLIFFDASDAKESSFASSRFKEAVAKRKEFRERADKEYVCVYIDNPKNAEAQGEVKDADRNGKLTEKFGITVFPTVVVTDAKGRPFGILEGYKINGVTAFLGLMDKWAADGKHLFALLAKFEAMPKDSPERRPRRQGPRFPGDEQAGPVLSPARRRGHRLPSPG